jgi:superfamily I DNA and RNA helicase
MCKAIGVAGRDTVILKHKAHTLHVMRPSKDWELYFPVRASRETAQKRLAEFNSNLAKAATKQEKAMTF